MGIGIERIKGFLWRPAETFEASKEETLSDAYVYFFLLLVIFSVLLAVIVGIVLANPVAQSILGMAPDLELLKIITALSVTGIIIGGTVGVLIAGIWIHIWAYAFGGRNGLAQTIKVLLYAATPLLVIGWIPVIGTGIGAIWSLLLLLTGLMHLQGMYSGRAILALVATLLVPVIIIGVIAVVVVGPAMLTHI
ncbi:MAG: YIP1 family protein [Methanophagales archaeon]|nr:YIP1 family protein [Methanophagales archaeon]